MTTLQLIAACLLVGYTLGRFHAWRNATRRDLMTFEAANELDGASMLKLVSEMDSLDKWSGGWVCKVMMHGQRVDIKCSTLEALVIQRNTILNQEAILKEIRA